MTRGFWATDWFAGLAVSALLATAAWLGYLEGLQRLAYDWGVRQSSAAASEQIAIIAIDDESIDQLGKWPWSRSRHADLLNMLAGGEPKMIAYTIPFDEPQKDPGLDYIKQLQTFVDESSLTGVSEEVRLLDALVSETEESLYAESPIALQDLKDFFQRSALNSRLESDVNELIQRLGEAERLLSTDRTLATSLAASGNVMLASQFSTDTRRSKQESSLPDYVLKNALTRIEKPEQTQAGEHHPIKASRLAVPISELGSRATAIGFLSGLAHADGAFRSEPLVIQYGKHYFPSLSLVLAASGLNLGTSDIKLRLGEGVQFGSVRIQTAPDLSMHPFFYSDRPNRPAFAVDSFYDVISGRIPVTKYRGKIVLVGTTAKAISSARPTPISPSMPPVVSLAHTVSSIQNQHYYTDPRWGQWVEIGAAALIALCLVLLLPRLGLGAATAVTLPLVAALVGTHMYLMIEQSMWLRLMLPLTMLLTGFLAIVANRLLFAEPVEPEIRLSDTQSARMSGLALQGQGQLDKAFEKFRKLPIDDSIMDLLYNLALDYERRQAFDDAYGVYQYMSEYKPLFRDLQQRMERSKSMAAKVAEMEPAKLTSGGTLILESDANRPMLGRYEVLRELGKGAMGTVFLGQDPTISRTVAIKTMALSKEFEEDEVEDVKARFFREAETAGRLSHPNTVTIFDAGEQNDLAYIAMEFLRGQDLTRFTKQDALLPITQVLEIVAKCADALAYAHAQNVVHRDIKPANVMYEDETGELKITDFGIARITDSSRTKTGMVLGTPSYMSPEQLAGKKVDGRSDLFSLGVMLFQLVTGRLPFQADSMANLMYKIANESHPSVKVLRPETPECVVEIVDKALSKDLRERYQTGNEMTRDIVRCLQSLPSDPEPTE